MNSHTNKSPPPSDSNHQNPTPCSFPTTQNSFSNLNLQNQCNISYSFFRVTYYGKLKCRSYQINISKVEHPYTQNYSENLAIVIIDFIPLALYHFFLKAIVCALLCWNFTLQGKPIHLVKVKPTKLCKTRMKRTTNDFFPRQKTNK